MIRSTSSSSRPTSGLSLARCPTSPTPGKRSSSVAKEYVLSSVQALLNEAPATPQRVHKVPLFEFSPPPHYRSESPCDRAHSRTQLPRRSAAELPNFGRSVASSPQRPERVGHRRSLSHPPPLRLFLREEDKHHEQVRPESTKRCSTPNRPSSCGTDGILASPPSPCASMRPMNQLNGSDRVQVAVRIRPYDAMADGPDSTPALEVEGTFVYPKPPKYERQGRAFQYDYVFTRTQEEVYEGIGKSMLHSFLQGYNVCLFAYGQTGSGKTYSMMGLPGVQEGIIPRLCKDLMHHNEERLDEYPNLTIKITMSYIEIYNEKVRDLLEKHVKGEELTSRSLYERDGRVFVRGLSTHQVLNYSKISQLIALGNARRQTCPTNMNETSSRSHSILQLTMTQTYDPPEVGCRDLESTITLVDLAGSERISKAELTGLSVEESKNINQSLLCLGRALNHFSQLNGTTGEKVPFLRSSKLTRLLSDCFGGNSRTWMLATVSPSAFNIAETVCTLEYAKNAKQILNAAKVNRLERAVEVKELQEKVRRLNEEVDRLLAEANRNADFNSPKATEHDFRHQEQFRALELEKVSLRLDADRYKDMYLTLQEQLEQAQQQLQVAMDEKKKVIEETKVLCQRQKQLEDQLAMCQSAERSLREQLEKKHQLLQDVEDQNLTLQQKIEELTLDFEQKLLDFIVAPQEPASALVCHCAVLQEQKQRARLQDEVRGLQKVADLLSHTLSEQQRQLLEDHKNVLKQKEEMLAERTVLQSEVNTLSGQLSGSREEVFKFIEENLKRENKELRDRNAVLLRLLNEQSDDQLLTDHQQLLTLLSTVTSDRDHLREQLRTIREAYDKQSQQMVRLLIERGGTVLSPSRKGIPSPMESLGCYS